MHMSGCLLRNPEYEKNMGSDFEDLETRLDEADIEVSTCMPQPALEDIAQATKSDAVLRDITEYMVHGWPETDAGLQDDLKLYYSLRDELAYHAGCVIKGNRVIVPEAIRQAILQRLYRTNLGKSKVKPLAQEELK